MRITTIAILGHSYWHFYHAKLNCTQIIVTILTSDPGQAKYVYVPEEFCLKEQSPLKTTLSFLTWIHKVQVLIRLILLASVVSTLHKMLSILYKRSTARIL